MRSLYAARRTSSRATQLTDEPGLAVLSTAPGHDKLSPMTEVTNSGLCQNKTVLTALRQGELAGARALLGALLRRLSIYAAARVLYHVARDKLRGEPFASLGPPADQRDQLSRRQCGDLVLLDRAVRRAADAETALAVAREIAHAGAVCFLDAMLPDFNAAQLRSAAPTLVGSFFNAEGIARIDEDTQELTFTVERCRFVELLRAVDAPHLTPLFCEADDIYFATDRRPIHMDRTQTLGTGGDSCDFHFRLKA